MEKGLKLAYGGTNTHILVIDLKSIPAVNGYPLKGDTAVRILDLAGIVANKNTIPGDIITAEASGVRLGTPWVTQRGITKEGIEELGDIIVCILKNIHPFSYIGLRGTLPRGKIDFHLLEKAKERVESLALSLRTENPWVWERSRNLNIPSRAIERTEVKSYGLNLPDTGIIIIRGKRALNFLGGVLTGRITDIDQSCGLKSFILDGDGRLIAPVILYSIEEKEYGERYFVIFLRNDLKERVISWLGNLSDGYVIFDRNDILRKIEGPVVVSDLEELSEPQRKMVAESVQKLIGHEKEPIKEPIDKEFLKLENGKEADELYRTFPQYFDLSKPYFVGQHKIRLEVSSLKKKEFIFRTPYSDIKNSEVRKSCLYNEHLKRSAAMVEFAGWMMPLRYESTLEEHRAVRQNAGLFDVSHMGILEVSGRYAEHFLDAVTTNYVSWIKNGYSQYSYLLDPDGNVIDDIMVYRIDDERFILVVNALNNEKDFEWLKAVNSGEYLIDKDYLSREVVYGVRLRDLKTGEVGGLEKLEENYRGRKDESSRDGMMVDIALQGPKSLDVLRELAPDDRARNMLGRVEKGGFIFIELRGVRMLLARTGYTGEEIGYEMLVDPSDAPRLWNILLDAGKPFGIKPAGLGARDSLRIEAGLPLYGHEIGGPFNISPIEAGFGPYVKFHKPFFIGRDALLKRMAGMRRVVVRFRMLSKGVRMARQGDVVVSHRTQEIIGSVTSCAVNHEGFQMGMAFVDARFSREGTQIAIVPAFQVEGEGRKSPGRLFIGARFPLHEDAIVLSRFKLINR
jgi:glycine hydroxymethyltransferase